jgi:hypothetical protein
MITRRALDVQRLLWSDYDLDCKFAGVWRRMLSAVPLSGCPDMLPLPFVFLACLVMRFGLLAQWSLMFLSTCGHANVATCCGLSRLLRGCLPGGGGVSVVPLSGCPVTPPFPFVFLAWFALRSELLAYWSLQTALVIGSPAPCHCA